jgi:hypothetical protein
LAEFYKKEYTGICEAILTKYGISKTFAKDIQSDTVLEISEMVSKGFRMDEIRNKNNFFYYNAWKVTLNYRRAREYGYNQILFPNQSLKTVSVDYDVVIEDNEYDYTLSDKALELINEPTLSMKEDFANKLFKIYLNEGSYRNVYKYVNKKIPLKTIALTLQDYKLKLIEKAKK